MLKRIIGPLAFLVFAWFIVSNEDAKTIIAGIAIFLIGMHYMEDGFKWRVTSSFSSTSCSAPWPRW